MPPPVLQVKQLHIRFADQDGGEAVSDVSFQIAAGSTLALVGASGSGKSLTSLALMGLLPSTAITSGQLQLGDTRLDQLLPADWIAIRGKRIGMIFQEPMSALNPVKTCGYQLVECILAHQKMSKSLARLKAIDWFNQVKLPDPKAIFRRYPHQLSGGQKQRVMIAMALCNHPDLLIADEPTTALDVTVQKEILTLIQQLQQQFHIGLLFITHDMGVARHIADDFLVLEQGKIVKTPPKSGDKVWVKAENVDNRPPILRVSNVKVYYPQAGNFMGKSTDYFKAVDDVSFELFPGETLGLVGESGCGKSTLSRSILRLQPLTSGHIYFDGVDISRLHQEKIRRLRRNIQIIFQDPYAALNQRMTIGAALAEPMLVHDLSKKNEVRAKVLRLLDQVQLPATSLDRYPHEFSGGQRQRICIARALALSPKFIICDESVSALDLGIQEQILDLLAQLQQQHQLSYLFITHDLNIVRRISHRIMVMQHGKIVEHGTTEEVMQQPREAYTRQLIAAIL